jgi:hypothetical protein
VLRDNSEGLGTEARAPLDGTRLEQPAADPSQTPQPAPGSPVSDAADDAKPPLRKVSAIELAYEVTDLTEALELRHGAIGDTSLVFARFGKIGAEAGIKGADRWQCTRDERFRNAFRSLCYRKLGRGPKTAVIGEAIDHLEARGFGLPKEPIVPRLAMLGGSIWLSLGPESPRVVRITPEGWEITQDPPVLFRHSDNADTLPEPARGGNIDLLRKYLPNVTDQDWPALVGFILACFVPEGAYPILCLSGPAESGKSFTTELVRRICDPVVALDARGEFPEKIEDLFTIAASQQVLSFDNLSRVDADISDALCTVTTGAARQVRLLYSQGNLHTLRVRNPVILNGITPGIDREDLVSRSVFVECTLPQGAKRKESLVRREFKDDLPHILGAILDGVVAGLRDGAQTTVEPRHRLEDAACFATAAEPVLGLPDGAIVGAWLRTQESTHADLCGTDPVVEGLRRLAFQGTIQTGTATDLLSRIRQTELGDGGTPLSRDFPRTAKGLSEALNRKQKTLEAEGFEIRRSRGRDARQIEITLKHAPGASPRAGGTRTVVVRRPSRAPQDGTSSTQTRTDGGPGTE